MNVMCLAANYNKCIVFTKVNYEVCTCIHKKQIYVTIEPLILLLYFALKLHYINNKNGPNVYIYVISIRWKLVFFSDYSH